MTSTREAETTSDRDLREIRQAVVDYCEGYYTRNPVQTARAYHSECLKRDYVVTEDDVWYLRVMTRASMVDVAGVERRKVDRPDYNIIIDDVSDTIASVRLYSDMWIDYLHVVKARGEWKLLHAAYTEVLEEEHVPSEADRDEITARVLDYVEAWYAGDAARHEKAYLPECVKRSYRLDSHHGQTSTSPELYSISPEHMAELCASGVSVLEGAEWEIIIDDIAKDVASVRVYSSQYVDFLHLAKARGRWGLFHVASHLRKD